MKKFLIIIFLINSIFASQNFIIKSLRTYQAGSETGFPLNNITIEFDVEADRAPGLKIVFRLCDRNWEPYENLFLINRGYDTEYNLWLESLPTTVHLADYHYKDSFPNKNVTFPFDGKWKYFIVDSFDDDLIYAEGKFIVAKNQLKLNSKLTKGRLQGVNLTPNNLERIYNLEVEFTLNDTLVPSRVMFVEVIENRKIDYPIIIDRDKYGDYRYYEWNASNDFKFIALDVFPGNEYRQTDLRNINRYTPPNVNAQIDRIETSRMFKFGERDLNGSSILTKFSDDYAQYMDVSFQIRPPEKPAGNIYVVGSFSDWNLYPEFMMNENDGLYSAAIELKRGIYDYQYVIAEDNYGKIENEDWLKLEGNFWDTSNQYHIFLYYESPFNGGFDQIISYQIINSRGL